MAFDLTRFKKISKRQEHTVFGYINNIQSLFPDDTSYYNIHDLIKQTCTLYYASIPEWDPKYISSRMKFIQETNSIEQIIQYQSGSSFLKDSFDSGVHHFRFRIDKSEKDDLWTTKIGIYKVNRGKPIIDGFFGGSDSYGYAYNVVSLDTNPNCLSQNNL